MRVFEVLLITFASAEPWADEINEVGVAHDISSAIMVAYPFLFFETVLGCDLRGKFEKIVRQLLFFNEESQ